MENGTSPNFFINCSRGCVRNKRSWSLRNCELGRSLPDIAIHTAPKYFLSSDDMFVTGALSTGDFYTPLVRWSKKFILKQVSHFSNSMDQSCI